MTNSPGRRIGAFFTAFCLTLSLGLAAGGLLWADANTRAAILGDGSLSYAVAGGDALRGVLDGGAAQAWTPRQLLPARIQALAWILDGERTVFGWLLS